MLTSAIWNNVLFPVNVDGDAQGIVSPVDALFVINEINSRQISNPLTGILPKQSDRTGGPYYDVSCDGRVSPLDALLVINHINRNEPGSGLPPGSGGVYAAAACSPVLAESTDYRSELSEVLTLPNSSSAIRVHFVAPQFDTSSVDRIPDAFEIEVTDLNGESLSYAFDANRSAIYNWSEGHQPESGPQVDAVIDVTGESDSTATVDLSGIPQGEAVRVTTRLVNNDGDTQTTVVIRGFEILAGSGERSGAVPISEQPDPTADLDLASFSEASALWDVEYGRSSLYENTLRSEVSFSNVTSFPLSAPLAVVVSNISHPSVRLQGFDAYTPSGEPLLILGASDTLVHPGASTPTHPLVFSNPTEVPFTYDLIPLSRLNQAAQITSELPPQALVDKPWTAAFRATDPDGDTITYTLGTAPAGMTIDASTGQIIWTPEQQQLGNHTLQLRADDGRGAIVELAHVVSVVSDLPNRPPRFTSEPIVDAHVANEYEYVLTASDDDSDDLTFSLRSSPAGLELVDSNRIRWTPLADQVGSHNVTLSVADTGGATALQSFSVLVSAEPGNNSPYFASTPQTTVGLKQGSIGHPVGDVTPSEIQFDLPAGETHQETVALTLADVVPAVDVFLLGDDTGSFRALWPALAEFFPSLIKDLQAALPDVDLGFGVGRFEHYGRDGIVAQSQSPFTLNQPIIEASEPEFLDAILSALDRGTYVGGSSDESASYIDALYQAVTGAGFDGNGDGDLLDSGTAGSMFAQLIKGVSGDVPPFSSLGEPYVGSFPFQFAEPRPIEFNEESRATLGPETERHLYSFAGVEGQRIRIELEVEGTEDPHIALIHPNGTPELIQLGDEFELSSTGTYHIHLTGFVVYVGNPPLFPGCRCGNSAPIDYALTVVNTSPEPVEPTGFGVEHIGQLQPGESRELAFQAPWGLRV